MQIGTVNRLKPGACPGSNPGGGTYGLWRPWGQTVLKTVAGVTAGVRFLHSPLYLIRYNYMFLLVIIPVRVYYMCLHIIKFSAINYKFANNWQYFPL